LNFDRQQQDSTEHRSGRDLPAIYNSSRLFLGFKLEEAGPEFRAPTSINLSPNAIYRGGGASVESEARISMANAIQLRLGGVASAILQAPWKAGRVVASLVALSARAI
jgi:hypothetical protein